MRSPNHIVLDFESSKYSYSERYWALRFLEDHSSQPDFVNNIDLSKKFQLSQQVISANRILKSQEKYTLKISSSHPASLMSEGLIKSTNSLNSPKKDSSEKKTLEYYLKYSKAEGRDAYMYLNLKPYDYTRRSVRRLFKLKKQNSADTFGQGSLNTWFNLVNVNFLRKERLYTKLKYSRTPAYDIVSGGAAALLAGFIGFLVSEKFGFELVDSGDFYYAFMYAVFVAFSMKPLLTAADPDKGFLDMFSLRRVFAFYSYLVVSVLEVLKKSL